MKNLKLNKKEIISIQNNFGSYLFIDEALEVIPKLKSVCKFFLKKDLWFFDVHWKNNPNMPGMLQLEALTQTASLSILSIPENKKKFMYLTQINNVRFFRKVVPEDELILTAELKNFKRGIASFVAYATVNEKLVCKCTFDLLLDGEINKYNKKK
jgi:3-hydroxyacyl-[acyl-carrier-protein] dehydratase